MDISDEGRHTYSPQGERLDRPFARPVQTGQDWMDRIAYWAGVLGERGVALGAFDDDALAGLAVLRFEVTHATAQLFALYVDRRHRRRGIASALLEAAERLSRERAQNTLFVSSVPNASAIDFYRARGFTFAFTSDLPTQQPQDIRMVKML
jgi:ribosomal protein S18 acetylase RimI-like enzyme